MDSKTMAIKSEKKSPNKFNHSTEENIKTKIIKNTTQSIRPKSSDQNSLANNTVIRTKSKSDLEKVVKPHTCKKDDRPSSSNIKASTPRPKCGVGHKMGELPGYLKKSKDENLKRDFNTLKKNLSEQQTKFFQMYNSLPDQQEEFNLVASKKGDQYELLLDGIKKEISISSQSNQNIENLDSIQIINFFEKINHFKESVHKLYQEFVKQSEKFSTEPDYQETGDTKNINNEILSFMKTWKEKFHESAKFVEMGLSDIMKEFQQSIPKQPDKDNATISVMEWDEFNKQLEAYKQKIIDFENKEKLWENKLNNEAKQNIDKLKHLLEQEKQENNILKENYENINNFLQSEKENFKENMEITVEQITELKEYVSKLERNLLDNKSVIEELKLELDKEKNVIKKISNPNNAENEEFNNLRESITEKENKIEELKCELSQAKLEIKQQAESSYMNQRLLKIRTEIINSLQEKDAYNRCHLNDLYTEISKSSLVKQVMCNDISAKAEELENLFSTLGTQQINISRQENIIKSLQEIQERNKKLRLKQDEKISRLKRENTELRNLLSDLKNSS